jgi:transposase
MRTNGTPKELEKRRRQAIVMLRSGKTFRYVAEKLKASLSSVVRWFQTYREKGQKGIRSQARWGRPPLLSEQQKTSLKKMLLQGAASAGHATDIWTLKRISTLIRSKYGIDYTHVGVWKLLRNNFGWSCQKPEKRALQRNEKAIAEWKSTTWPSIKKSPKTWGPSGLSRRKRVLAHTGCP